MRSFLLTFLLFASAQLHVNAADIPADSIGVEENDGVTFILHEVEAKETLYSLSRRYNVTIYQIIENNPPSEFGLTIGQIIKIPFLKREPAVKHSPAEGEKIHSVKSKETIFSISRMYDVSIADIKAWNDLQSDLLEIGQELIIRRPEKDAEKGGRPASVGKTYVVKAGETLYSISKQFNITIQELKTWNEIENNEISIGEQLIVGKPTDEPVYAGVSVKDAPKAITAIKPAADNAPENETPELNNDEGKNITTKREDIIKSVNKDKPVRVAEESTTFEEVSESGMAQLIEVSENTRKYLALHRSAPIGTILRVRNEMNDQEVFVRVLGRLPDTGVDKNVIIKISKPAYERLGAIDPKFRVSISYIP